MIYKTPIFIVLCIVVASCNKEAKPTISEEEKLLIVDTLQLAYLQLSLSIERSDDVQDLGSEQDLIIKIEQGNFKSLSQHYYGSTSYANLLKNYNGYRDTDTLQASTDALRIPIFINLVCFPEQKTSQMKSRTMEALVTVYEEYRVMEYELRSLSKSGEGLVDIPDELKRQLYQLSDQVAAVYAHLQLETNRPHKTIGALKALSSYLTRMAQDTLQINDKSLDITHHRLAEAFITITD